MKANVILCILVPALVSGTVCIADTTEAKSTVTRADFDNCPLVSWDGIRGPLHGDRAWFFCHELEGKRDALPLPGQAAPLLAAFIIRPCKETYGCIVRTDPNTACCALEPQSELLHVVQRNKINELPASLSASEVTEALNYAIIFDRADFIAVLEPKLNFNALGPLADRLLRAAIDHDRESLVLKLLKARVQILSDFRSYNPVILRALVAHGADLNAEPPTNIETGTGVKGRLQEAIVVKKDPKLVRLLLELGANPNRTYWGPKFAPLAVAMQIGNKEIIEILRKAGAKTPTELRKASQ